ncbi:hypothetical protein OSTOST_09580 [Ostertagia ostertagi]
MNTVIFVLAMAGAVHCHPTGKEGFGRVPDALREMLLPPFLKTVSGQARIEYFAIVMSMNDTIAQQKQNILAWGQKYGIEAQVEEFNTNLTSTIKGVKQNVTELINSLPPTLQQYTSLIENENQTPPLELKKSTGDALPGIPFDKSSFQGTATGAGFGGYNMQSITPY